MKCDVTYSCGHTGVVELVGPAKSRESKLKWYEEVGLCPKCYAASKRKEEEQQGLYINVTVLPGINEKTGEILLGVWFSGNTLKYKEEIKSLKRYRWDDVPSAESYYTLHKPDKAWCCTIDFCQLQDVLEEAYGIGAEKTDVEKGLWASVHYEIALKRKAEWERMREKILALSKPQPPSCIVGKRWNHKVYGKAGSYTIYLDSEKTMISDEVAEQLFRYVQQQEEYEKQVKQIRSEKQ